MPTFLNHNLRLSGLGKQTGRLSLEASSGIIRLAAVLALRQSGRRAMISWHWR